MASTHSLLARGNAKNTFTGPDNLPPSSQANEHKYISFIGNPDDVSYWRATEQAASQANLVSHPSNPHTVGLTQVDLLSATGILVTLDETTGLQNGVSIESDKDDNDVDASAAEVTADTDVSTFTTFLTGLGLGTPINYALSGYDGSNSGLNVVNAPADAKLAFTDASGNALDGFKSTLETTSGVPIYLYTAGSDSLAGHFVIGREGMMSGGDYVANPNGAVVLAAYLDQVADGAKIWTALYEPLHHPVAGSTPEALDDAVDLTNQLYVSAIVDNKFTLENAPSGQNLFLMLGNEDSSLGVVVTGKNPADQSNGARITTGDTVNTSQASDTTIGTNNQAIDPPTNKLPGEGMYFTFVKSPVSNYTIPNLDQNEADVEANIQFGNAGGLYADQSGAAFFISQMTPGKLGTVKISAFETASQPGEAYITGGDLAINDTKIPIDMASISVYTLSNTGEHIPVTGLTITTAGGSVTISGVTSQCVIEYQTLNDAMHNRLLVENVGSDTAGYNSSFDIGWISVGSTTSDKEEVGSKLVFEDDGPSISTTGTEPTLTVDETDLSTNATSGFAANFSSAFGNDGAGTLTYALGINAGSTGLVDTATNQAVVLSVVSGVVEGRTATSNDLVFTVSVAANGDVTLDQMRAVVHPDATNPDDAKTLSADNLVTLTATKTDKDGDSAQATLNIGQNLVFEDDGPSISITGDLPMLTVDETDLTLNATGDFSGNFVPAFGADGPKNPSVQLDYALGVSEQGAMSSLVDTASGHKVYLFLESGVIYGREGTDAIDAEDGYVVLQISVNGSGVVTLDQQRAVMHPDASNPDDSIGLGLAELVTLKLTATATDKDDDTFSASINIADRFALEDDGPSAFTPGSVTLSNTGTDVKTGDLDFIGHSGADQPASVYFVDNVPADNYLRSTGGTLLTSGKENIVLSGFGTGVLTAKMETSQSTVFTATLSPGSDQYTIDFDRALDDGSGLIILGAAPLKQGNVAYNIINDVSGSSLDILFSGTVPGNNTVNVSTQGAGVGNQTMDAGENLRLDFMSGAVFAGKTGSAFDYSSYQNVNGFSFLFSQNTPSGSSREGTVYVRAFDDSVGATDNVTNLTNDPPEQITKIMIGSQVLVDGNTLNTLIINGHTVQAIRFDGGVVITGLNEGATGDGAGGDDPLIKVYTADGYNRIEIANYSGETVNSVTLPGSSFDIAAYGIEQTQQGNPIDFQLPVQIADHDLDTTPVALIGVHVDPVPIV